MSRNSIGKNLVITSFGESHGSFIGAVVDGFPANFTVNLSAIQQQLNRRKPGQSALTTQRAEDDQIQCISGIFEGKSLGSPITFLIANKDQKPEDYQQLKDQFRPGHADLLYQQKYGHRDHRGGGRSSARITAGWVAAGALAQQWLQENHNIQITAWVNQIHHIQAETRITQATEIPSLQAIDASPVRCPDPIAAKQMETAIQQAKTDGNSLGGIIQCYITGVPMGVGEPVFGKLQAQLALYLTNINAVKGISFGEGFQAAHMKGSEHNDAWIARSQANHTTQFGTKTNHAGGIVGGIATGEPIWFQLAFKPTSSIALPQNTVNSAGETVELETTGRHDPCVLPRAVPIVESMSALALMDLILEK